MKAAAKNGNNMIVNYLLSQPKIRIKSRLFTNCSMLIEIKLPESIDKIKSYAFYGCALLERVLIPSSVTKIESHAFENCFSLKKLQIPSSVTKIGDYCFCNCILLKEINISSLIEEIGNSTFRNCVSLEEISLPSSICVIGDYSFAGCCLLARISIQKSIYYLGRNAFNGCSHLTEFKIPEKVTTIESYVFADCTSLSRIKIHDSIKSIKDYAFNNCSSLIEFILPSSVISIGESAFGGCSSLKNFIIPSNVVKIGDRSFQNCASLKPIEIPSSVSELGKCLFIKYTSESFKKEKRINSSFYINRKAFKIENKINISNRNYIVEYNLTGELYIEKVFDNNNNDNDNEFINKDIEKELRLRMDANHPLFIKFYGYSIDFNGKNLFMYFEKAANNSLSSLLKKCRRSLAPYGYDNTSRQIILIGVARGMKYLCDCGIFDNFITPDKILLDENFHPQINMMIFKRNNLNNVFSNDLLYAAPEIIKYEKFCKTTSVYNFAILMFEIISEQTPFDHEVNNLMELYKVVDGCMRPVFKSDFEVENSIKDLIYKCWDDDPLNRPYFEEIFNLLAYDEKYYLDLVDVDIIKNYVNEITSK